MPMRRSTSRSRRTSRPTARLVAFSALRERASATSSPSNLDTHEVTNLTNDEFADYAPTYSPDGKFIVYIARVSGNEKLFRLDLDTEEEDAAHLRHARRDRRRSSSTTDTLVFSSTATDPTEPIEPEVAQNGNIYNIWTLNLKTGELQQYTDALGGNLSPVVLHGRQELAPRVRQLLQGRVRPAHARAQGAAAHGGVAPTSARPARSSTSRRRSRTRWSPRTSARRARSRRCSSRAGRR